LKTLLFILINSKLWAELMAVHLLQLSNSLHYKKLLSDFTLHAAFPPQAAYFWEISDKIVLSLLLSGNIFFQKLCGPFFQTKVWQFDKLCLLLSHKNKHE